MRSAKRKQMTATSVAVAWLIGTGSIVAVGQERKPDPPTKAEAGKPDPEWNKGTPTAFPDIEPYPRSVHEVLKNDPTLRKLQKTKLNVAGKEQMQRSQFLRMGDIRSQSKDMTLLKAVEATQEEAATGVELADRPSYRRIWLESCVRNLKDIESVIVDQVKFGVTRPSLGYFIQRHRLDAEIALQRHILNPGKKVKAAADPLRLEPDPEWNKYGEVPTAVPDIKPFSIDLIQTDKDSPEQLQEKFKQFDEERRLAEKKFQVFLEKRNPQVLESDPPLRKLQKAKLRAAVEELKSIAQSRSLPDSSAPYETKLTMIAQGVREVVAAGVEVADRAEDRQEWLEFGVREQKVFEASIKDRARSGIADPGLVSAAQRYRLDAEIALERHILQPGEKGKAEVGKPDPLWNKKDEVPTAFPHINGEPNKLEKVPPEKRDEKRKLAEEKYRAYVEKRIPTVLESDSTLRKLQKAKLRVAVAELVLEHLFAVIGAPGEPMETTRGRLSAWVREVVAAGVEVAVRAEDRQEWLEFGIREQKEFEAFAAKQVKAGISRPMLKYTAQRCRLDAEIALQKFIDQSKVK